MIATRPLAVSSHCKFLCHADVNTLPLVSIDNELVNADAKDLSLICLRLEDSSEMDEVLRIRRGTDPDVIS